MSRVRVSIAVDQQLLAEARALSTGTDDAELLDAALAALLASGGRTETDRIYAEAYAKAPIDMRDAWGDLDAFRRAAASS